MGYNLRQSFLLANAGFAAELIQLAKEEGWKRVVLDTPEDAANLQYRVNNVLYALAKWQPDKAWVRKTVRTKLVWEDNHTVLYIGIPPVGVRLRGAPPQAVILQNPPNKVEEYVVNEEISADNWVAVSMGLVKAANDPLIQSVIVRHPPNEPAGVRFIAEQLAKYGFNLERTAPEMILRREHVAASANVAQEGV